MRMRGSSYYKWADSQLPNLSHVEDYGAGLHIDVVVRLSRHGITQLFIGIYENSGMMMVEEYIDSLPGRTTSQAMQWGIERAKAFIEGAEANKVLLMKATRYSASGHRSDP